jgi:phosphate starvation-inducible PhoH-like protein
LSSTQVKISVPANHLMPALLGVRDEVLRAVEAAFPEAAIHVRGNEIAVDGPDAERVAALFEDLLVLVEQGHRLDPSTVRRSVDMVRHDERPAAVLTSEVLRPARGRPIRPKSSGQ